LIVSNTNSTITKSASFVSKSALPSCAINTATHYVDIWTVPLDEPRPLLLNPEERARAARFVFEHDRRRWSNARSALRAVLARYLNQAPADLSFAFGPNGKPAIEGIEFNLSHASAWALIAVSGDIPVGVDLEAIRGDVEIDKILARIGETNLPESLERLFHVWSRREARVKAVGGALWELPSPHVHVVDLEGPEGFASSLALVDREPVPRYCGGAV
jgi:phosphopantetheinyl transferase